MKNLPRKNRRVLSCHHRHCCTVVITVLALLLISRADAQEAVVFAQLAIPVGIATDSSGNVFINSDATFYQQITKFAPSGRPVSQVPIGNMATVGGFRLATDPGNGKILMLHATGELYLFDPDTGQVSHLISIRSLSVDTRAVYDVSTGAVDSFGGLILPEQTHYGDLAVWRRGNRLDLFVSGISVAFPYVMRIRIRSDGVSAKVLVSSRTSTAPENNAPRGVAVNTKGTVLTTLPMLGKGRVSFYDRLIAFSANFPEGDGFSPKVLFAGADFRSSGMTADTKGNFYVATGPHGTTLCGGSGDLAFISSNLKKYDCYRMGQALMNSQDVAVSPSGDYAYMTVLGFMGSAGTVFRFSLQ